ncbi:MAG: DUF4244 domain-containing protein [Pseudonocardiaceae bacterium]
MTTQRSTATGPRWWRLVIARLAGAVDGEAGMSTVEYAIGTIAAAAFAAVLYKVVTGDMIVGALNDLVQRALSVTFKCVPATGARSPWRRRWPCARWLWLSPWSWPRCRRWRRSCVASTPPGRRPG